MKNIFEITKVICLVLFLGYDEEKFELGNK